MAAVLFFHAPEYMAVALDARDRAAEARRSDKTVMAPDAIVSIVMAAVATEAFINELGAYYDTTQHYLQPSEDASRTVLAELDERGSTELKYLAVSLTLSGQMFDRSSQPFQNFSTLMKIRNDLVHPRPLDRFEHAGATVTDPEKGYVREFERSGMTYEREAGVSVSWFNLLETDRVASWACCAAADIIIAIVSMMPPDSSLAPFGRSFTEHYGPRAHS